MSDMPDTAFLQEGQRFPDQTVHGRGGGWSNFAFDGATAYIRADKYADLERQRDELVELLKSWLEYRGDIYHHEWLSRDTGEALAKAEKDDE
jgi:hypothetical protein